MNQEQGNNFYITTAIPYVNGPAHLGFAMELVETDVIARFQRSRKKRVFFLTGADENSLKNVRASEELGISVETLVDKNTDVFRRLGVSLEISNDEFIRTTSRSHFLGTQALWLACDPDDLYKKSYKGLYCVGCEAFLAEQDLVDGKCAEHKEPLELVEEENYFFRLSRYQKDLERLIESGELKIIPEFRKSEVLNFIKLGLIDFSVSRSSRRAKGWGVPVPKDNDQIMYVWFDALGNYLTGLQYPDAGPESLFHAYWPANVHVLGKGIIRFHAVYWPAILLSAGLALPKNLFVHGYINFGGSKLSKSTGGGVDPFALIQKYGAEAVRYHLIRHCHPFQDSEFSVENLEHSIQGNLSNGLGNVVQRILTLLSKQTGPLTEPVATSREETFKVEFLQVLKPFDQLLESFELQKAFDCVWSAIGILDGYLETAAPWKLAKKPGTTEELNSVLWNASQALRIIASYTSSLLPKTSREILNRLNDRRNEDELTWEDQTRWGVLPIVQSVEKGSPLFPRIEIEQTVVASVTP